jgi:hypothetical protein
MRELLPQRINVAFQGTTGSRSTSHWHDATQFAMIVTTPHWWSSNRRSMKRVTRLGVAGSTALVCASILTILMVATDPAADGWSAGWQDRKRSAFENTPCPRRIFEATLDARLVALDAATGAPCADFGGARFVHDSCDRQVGQELI